MTSTLMQTADQLVSTEPMSAEFFNLPVFLTAAAHAACIAWANELVPTAATTPGAQSRLRDLLDLACQAVLMGRETITYHRLPLGSAAAGAGELVALPITYRRDHAGKSMLILSLPGEGWTR